MKVQESYLYKDQHYLFIQKYPTKSAFVLNLLLHIKPFFYLTMHFALFWKIISPHLFLLSLFSFEFVKQLLCLKLKFKHHSINHLLRSRDLMRHFPCTIFWPFYCLVFAQTNLYRIRTEDHPIIFSFYYQLFCHTSGGVSYFWPGKKLFLISSSSSSSSSPRFFLGLAFSVFDLSDFFLVELFDADFFAGLLDFLSLDFDFGVVPLFKATFFFFLLPSSSESLSSFAFFFEADFLPPLFGSS